MTVVIKRSSDIQLIIKTLNGLQQTGKFKPERHCGVLKLKRKPLDIQNAMRDEWQ
jgi:hypothetical protein